MTNRWGRDELEWSGLVDAGYEILVRLSGKSELIDYSQLSLLLHEATGYEPFRFSMERDQAAIGALLYDIAERARHDVPDGRMILSAAVLLKGGDLPGEGFFRYAVEIGLMQRTADFEVKFVTWKTQWERCQDRYAKA